MSATTTDPALLHALANSAPLDSLASLTANARASDISVERLHPPRAQTWKRPAFRFTLGRRALPEIIRRLHEPLLATLRLTDDLELRSVDPLAARVIEQQSHMLDELTNLTEELLSIMDAEQFVRFNKIAADGVPCNRIYSVVLVADDATVLSSLRIALLCSGCKVLAFRSAEAAVMQLQNVPQAVDLVITELELAGKEDGLLLIESLRREQFPSLPAIVLGKKDCASLREPGLPEDVHVLTTPVNLVELKQKVGTLL